MPGSTQSEPLHPHGPGIAQASRTVERLPQPQHMAMRWGGWGGQSVLPPHQSVYSYQAPGRMDPSGLPRIDSSSSLGSRGDRPPMSVVHAGQVGIQWHAPAAMATPQMTATVSAATRASMAPQSVPQGAPVLLLPQTPSTTFDGLAPDLPHDQRDTN